MIWITLPTLVAKVATNILPSTPLIISSRVLPITFSDIDRPVFFVHKLSPIYNLTHSTPILPILAKSAGLSTAGV